MLDVSNRTAQGDKDVVRKVIDLECLLPPDEQGKPRQYHEQASHRIGYGDPELLPPRPGYGFDNYKNIFRKRVDGPAKSGAEGLLLVADVSREQGIAIKCEDGAMRAVGPAAVELLGTLGVLEPREQESLAAHRRTPVANAAGQPVGWLEGHVSSGASAQARA